MEKSIAGHKCYHSWIHLDKWCLGWTNANSFVKDFMICIGPFVESVGGPKKINLYSTCDVANNAGLLFDKMSSRGNFIFCGGNGT